MREQGGRGGVRAHWKEEEEEEEEEEKGSDLDPEEED